MKIFVAGATGMVGSALINKLIEKGYENIVGSYHHRQPDAKENIRYETIDLLNQQAVADFMAHEKFDQVYLAAAKVGGIIANNTYRGQFIYENLQIQNNIIHQSYVSGVKKLLFLGSSCIYPKACPQPIKESYLLTDPLEYTNEPYAIAKIAGIKLCESYNLQYGTNFIAVMPTNLYGFRDNYDLEKSHVLPALIRKMHLAKQLMNQNFEALSQDFEKHPVSGLNDIHGEQKIVEALANYGISRHKDMIDVKLWGTGKPRREFLHANDLADACIYLMKHHDFQDVILERHSSGQTEIRNTHINIGTGSDISIRELAEKIRELTDFQGTISWDSNKPDGTYQKLLDVNKLHNYGWQESISLEEGLRKVYADYCKV